MESAKRHPNFTVRRCVLFLALVQALAAHAQSAVTTLPPTVPAGSTGADQSGDVQASTKPTKPSAANATQLAEVTVTAEKRTENIQTVPIAITALSGEDLNDRKIETGADLVRAVPNVSFTKTNFASYNFQIRGIGTQALSVTTDPAVAVSFNDTPLIRNRLFEQEYFDVNNVEVLRGPQGTLYGRNATAGVVNMIPNLPTFDGFESWIKGELGNFDGKRFSGMVNIPLSNTLAFRLAGAWTDRSGYMYNTVNNTDVDGRNLWSGRMSLAWKPAEGINATLIWEHFNENDNRARTGKQLCHNDPGPASVAGVTPSTVDRNFMSQGCANGSLYGAGAFGVPNGASLPQVLALGTIAGVMGGTNPDVPPNFTGVNTYTPYGTDPYAGVKQSTDLRQIATSYDPKFRAKNDVVQFNFDAEVGDNLKFISQTLFTRDSYYSTQDYSRFQSNPIFTPSDGFVNYMDEPIYQLTPGGVYNDPQLGKSDRFLEVDLSRSKSHQFSQEFRLQSSNDGAFNFSVGVNYLDFKIDEDYFVFNNAFSLLSENYFNTAENGFGSQPVSCPRKPVSKTGDVITDLYSCLYIDPNPLANINGDGHNYFRSRNAAQTKSKALFGEGYWQLADDVKLTAGARYTHDAKSTTPYPSQLLLKPGLVGGGLVNSGYPASPDINQTWNEFTGRLVLDWNPQLSFTDSTLFYTSFSRGYKAGGTNSPGIGADPLLLGFSQHPSTFKPEFINAFELGTKNTMLGGKMTLNADVFYYNYKNYQISQIQDRATLNENFNAKTWGAEIEAAWMPSRELRFDGTLGLLGTRVDSNQYSIDVMNRTQGNPDWVTMRPWIQQASDCIAPAAAVAQVMKGVYSGDPNENNGGNAANILYGFCPYSPAILGNQLANYGVNYNPLTDAPNGGQGFSANVGGKSLPNSPKITFNLGAQYTFFFGHANLTVRADYYHQSASWARVYNDPIDRLHAWGNANLSLSYDRTDTDLTVQLYVRNLLDSTPITGTFLNSDDSGLTSNVFTLDPRIIGLSIRKGFD